VASNVSLTSFRGRCELQAPTWQVVSGRVTPAQPDIEDVEGIRVHRLPWTARRWLRFLRMPSSLFAALFRLRNSYDVVHLHQHSWFGLYVILIARLLRKPILTKLPNVGTLEYRECAPSGSG